MAEPAYDFEKLAREITASKLKDAGEKVAESAAQVAKDMLTSSLKSTGSKQDPKITVVAVCRGVLGGLLLNGQPLDGPCVAVLNVMADVSHTVTVTPEDLMTWAMQGFAEIAAMAGPEASHTIESAIESSFMGAGAVFAQACAEARKKGAS